ncbi:hypothetical protein [Azospirillum brasilense]|uniref:hypothetical protein n=1 Tax=Azospirillum brasilense TaxID=192 RepID=UPI001ED9DC9F|nr:hypothetical protein [Azospirillum brasilense]UKJ76693.1 hypothetical protein H1Q64_23495 [Azospirillum brasilense]
MNRFGAENHTFGDTNLPFSMCWSAVLALGAAEQPFQVLAAGLQTRLGTRELTSNAVELLIELGRPTINTSRVAVMEASSSGDSFQQFTLASLTDSTIGLERL